MDVARAEIHFVGGARLEAEAVPKAGFPFSGLQLAGLDRQRPLRNWRLPLTVGRAVGAIRRLLTDREVSVALGLGGYVTVPLALAARREAVPLFIAEQNASAGLANRLASRWAERVFTSFPQTAGLPRPEWVGNPIRASLADFASLTDIDRAALAAAAHSHFDLPEGGLVVGVMGGSLGAAMLNEAARILAASEPGYAIVNLAGATDFESQSAYARHTACLMIVRGFEERMELFYAAIDLVVGRAGGVVAEYTATATPAVLVPGGFGSGGHQRANARALEEAGAAVVVDEGDLSRLPAAVEQALRRLPEMKAAAQRLARPHAARDIARAMLAGVTP